MSGKNKKGVVSREFTQSRQFAYQKGGVSLSFSLRTDIKQEMKDFVECLEAAITDVKEEIAKK